MTDYGVFSLAGQRALVTGSSDGLGLAIARLLADAGAEVWINGRDNAKLEAIAKQEGGQFHIAAFDVSDAQGRKTAIGAIEDAGGIDILVNNVGARDRRSLDAFTAEDVSHLLDVNLSAPFLLSQHAGLKMAERGYGRIVNVSSIAGLIAQTSDALYTTSKGGINAMTKALAAELGPRGVNVNAVAPGFFKTAPNEAAAKDESLAAKLTMSSALGRWGDPEELAPVVLMLASRASSYVTGQIIAVDGGYTSHY